MQKVALVVHGYRLERADGVYVRSRHLEDVCRYVVELREQGQYQRIFLLGGGPRYENTAIDEQMRRQLIEEGIASTMIFTRKEIPELASIPQPLDTIDEAHLVKALQGVWTGWAFDSIAVDTWVPRIKRIYRALGVTYRVLHRVRSRVPLMQGAMEGVLRLLARFDPLGEGKITGFPQRFVRRIRT